MSPSTLMSVLSLVVPLLAMGILVAIYLHFIAYWPVAGASRARLREQRMYHYRPSEFVDEREEGTVFLSTTKKWQVLFPLLRRVEATYLYAGRNGRGGKFNHPRQKADKPYSLVEIEGADFMTWAGDRRLYYRSRDGALAVCDAYEGPAMVAHDIHPRVDRNRL